MSVKQAPLSAKQLRGAPHYHDGERESTARLHCAQLVRTGAISMREKRSNGVNQWAFW
jgi:hypothetical protein